jgi:hypothetical protein
MVMLMMLLFQLVVVVSDPLLGLGQIARMDLLDLDFESLGPIKQIERLVNRLLFLIIFWKRFVLRVPM